MTCFTSTKIQILTQQRMQLMYADLRMLQTSALRCPRDVEERLKAGVHWYKSTNTDTSTKVPILTLVQALRCPRDVEERLKAGVH